MCYNNLKTLCLRITCGASAPRRSSSFAFLENILLESIITIKPILRMVDGVAVHAKHLLCCLRTFCRGHNNLKTLCLRITCGAGAPRRSSSFAFLENILLESIITIKPMLRIADGAPAPRFFGAERTYFSEIICVTAFFRFSFMID